MAVTVYPRLGGVLRARGLSVLQLKRDIEETFGLSVDAKTLYRLASGGPIQRADLNIAGAISKILEINLGDLFSVEAVALDAGVDGGDDLQAPLLDPEESQRMAQLFERQSDGTISMAEQRELETLVADYGLKLRALRIRQLTKSRGLSTEEAERLIAEEVRTALAQV